MNKIIIPQTLATRITVKNVKSGFGHDLLGLFADIYLDKKKVGYYNDDGSGGDVDIQLSTDARKTIEDKLVECNYAQQLFDNGWAFMGTVDKIRLPLCVEQGLFAFIYHTMKAQQAKKNARKYRAKFKKDMHKGICVGTDTDKPYSLFTFKNGHDLKDVVRFQGAKFIEMQIQLYVKPKMKEGERILNTNLKDLGINLEN